MKIRYQGKVVFWAYTVDGVKREGYMPLEAWRGREGAQVMAYCAYYTAYARVRRQMNTEAEQASLRG